MAMSVKIYCACCLQSRSPTVHYDYLTRGRAETQILFSMARTQPHTQQLRIRLCELRTMHTIKSSTHENSNNEFRINILAYVARESNLLTHCKIWIVSSVTEWSAWICFYRLRKGRRKRKPSKNKGPWQYQKIPPKIRVKDSQLRDGVEVGWGIGGAGISLSTEN